MLLRFYDRTLTNKSLESFGHMITKYLLRLESVYKRKSD